MKQILGTLIAVWGIAHLVQCLGLMFSSDSNEDILKDTAIATVYAVVTFAGYIMATGG